MAFALTDQFAVPFKTIALKGIQDRGLGTGHFPRRVEVFHAQQPATTHGSGIEIGREGGDQRAKVQVATGRWGEAPDVGGCSHGRGPIFCGSGLARDGATRF